MKSLTELAPEALHNPEIDRLATEYPYEKGQIAALYMVYRGDIQAIEATLSLSIRSIDSSLIAAAIDGLRESK